jgi:tellurite resistance protein
MGLLEQVEQIRSEDMGSTNVILTPREAGVLLAARTAFSDGDCTADEALAIKKFYGGGILPALEKKLSSAGLRYPEDLGEMDPLITAGLLKGSRNEQLRAMAVAMETAQADGTIDREELSLLARYCTLADLTLAEAALYRQSTLREWDMTEPEEEFSIDDIFPELTPAEASLALTAWVAFSDDNPTSGEVALIRDNFTVDTLKSLDAKMTAARLGYPVDLSRLKQPILDALSPLNREEKHRILSLARKTAEADGLANYEEQTILKQFTDACMIGWDELLV